MSHNKLRIYVFSLIYLAATGSSTEPFYPCKIQEPISSAINNPQAFPSTFFFIRTKFHIYEAKTVT